jgi:hypothetical protein
MEHIVDLEDRISAYEARGQQGTAWAKTKFEEGLG